MTPVRREGEEELAFIWRACEQREELGWTWPELAEFLNDTLGHQLTECSYRKTYQAAKAYYEKVFSKMQARDVTEALRERRIELAKEKQRLRDERTQYGQYIRQEARLEQKLSHLEEIIQSHGEKILPTSFFDCEKIGGTIEKEVLVLLGDWHIGLNFQNDYGRYNTGIAAERLRELFWEIKQFQEAHGYEVCHVAILGDMISGGIHPSLRVSESENLIEQIQSASEMLVVFIGQLCRLFTKVDAVSVAGNHTRLDPNKDKAIKSERYDDLIAWYVKAALGHVQNFKMLPSIDNSLATMEICGKRYAFAHGDNDVITQNGMGKLAFMLGEIPYAVCVGHKHFPMYTEVNDVKVLQSGSLCGSGDDYTVSKRLTGQACQCLAVCDSDGVEEFVPVYLD